MEREELREDPLERIARQEQEKKANKGLQYTMYAMIAVAAVLACALIYIWSSKSSLVKELDLEKQELTAQIEALQSDYEQLSSEYDSINLQLDSSREEVAQLVERIKHTESTNRSKIRQYEKELGTLRSIMRGYIVQIESLNTLNHQLTADAAQARREAAQQKRRNEELAEQVEDLAGKVQTGSILKARGLRLEAYNKAGNKAVTNHNSAHRLLATLSLVENDLAPKGNVRVFVRVTDPNGNLLQDGSNTSFLLGEENLAASASREVEYNGAEVELSIYINNIPSFVKGIYTLEAYTTQARLGSAELMLR